MYNNWYVEANRLGYVLFKKRAGVYYKVLKIGGEAEYVISNVNG